MEDAGLFKVREYFDLNSQPLTDTDLTELEQLRTYDEKAKIASEGEGCVSKEILVEEQEQMFRNLGIVQQQIMDLYPNVEGSMLVRPLL